MTKAEIAQAVQQWFNIDNYAVLDDLTLEQLLIEIDNRAVTYRMMEQWDSLSSDDKTRLSHYEDELLTGKVLFESLFGKPKKALSSSYVVQPVTKTDVRTLAGYVNTIDMQIAPEEILRRSKNVSLFLKEAEVNKQGIMLAEFHLAKASTETIIEHLRVLIPEWKKQLQAPVPVARDYRFGVSSVRKILDYNIIPLMDLLFWGACNNAKMGIPQLTGFIYPKKINAANRGQDMVKATDFPLAVSFLTDLTYQQSIEDFIFKYNDDRHRKVWDFIKINLGYSD